MSKVISFRLNPDNPRDAKAIDILQKRLSQGYSKRHTLTEALLNLDVANFPTPKEHALNELSDQIKLLLKNFESGAFRSTVNDVTSLKDNLSKEFVSSIILTAKPGLNYSEKEG